MQFAPGTNWSYSHTNFMILGEILAKIGGKPLDELLRDKVLGPMGLTTPRRRQTVRDPEPRCCTRSAPNAAGARHPAGRPFYEESTFWNAGWGTPSGANQTTTIADLAATAKRWAPASSCPRRATAP